MNRLCFGFLFALIATVACNRNFNIGDKTIAKIDGSSISVNEFLLKYNQLKTEQDEVSRSNPKVMDGVKATPSTETIIIHIIREEAKRRGLRIPQRGDRRGASRAGKTATLPAVSKKCFEDRTSPKAS
ncbi:MAG: hypothetical protein R3B54_17900 [Bdellovibrionota bacterium]